MNLDIHLPEDCPDVRQHCSWHNIDEPQQPGDYRTCGECGHIYRTARDLRWAYRRDAWRMAYGYGDWLTYMLAALTVRASRILCCVYCGHDFIGEAR